MLVLRYFLFVGSALVGLLFLADSYFPLLPSAASAGDVDRSIIRIHSAQQWPAPVRFDTTQPVPQVGVAEVDEESEPMSAVSPQPSNVSASLPPSAKAGDPSQRRTKLAARSSKRKVHRRIASSQPNWTPDW
jgi:hypothetical protein